MYMKGSVEEENSAKGVEADVPTLTAERPKYKVRLEEGIEIDPNETFEDGLLIYTPINALKFNWDLYEKTLPQQIEKIKADYNEEKDKYNIIGLVVYKADGGWCWSGTPLVEGEEPISFTPDLSKYDITYNGNPMSVEATE
jgi:hypothetical protein